MPHALAKHAWLAPALVSMMLVAACSSGDPAAPGPKAPDAPTGGDGTGSAQAPTGPTFHKDVQPILASHCQKCHVEGGLAPFALVTYADAHEMSAGIALQTTARTMPPWGAQDTAECKPRLPWNHDERLTDVEIKTLADWDAAGAPEGDPKDAVAVDAPPPLVLKDAQYTLSPKAPFVASGDRDEFQCFVLDSPIPAGGYVTGIHVLPGNPKVVHHAVVFTDPTGAFAAQADPVTGSFPCSSAAMANAGGGGAMMGGGQDSVTLDVWTPGGQPVDLPPTIAMPIPANAKLVMQIHYSPGGATAAPDTTRVQLRTSTARPDYLLFTTAIGNFAKAGTNGDGLLPGDADPGGVPTFLIPANDRSHVEKMQATIPTLNGIDKVWIYGVLAHEHLAGIDVKIDVVRPADSECLLQDRWDFHWQRMYTYASPVENLPTLAAGDKIAIRCTYDNSMMNKRLGAEYKARGLVPIDLKLGEQTTDEMCLAIPQLLIKNPNAF
jgi:hypothetical protein